MRKMKDSGVEWIGDIPESWDAVKLSYLFEIIGSGTTPTSTNSDYYDGEYNWLQTGDLNDKEITTTSKTITQKAVDDYSTLALYNKGTIVMAMYGATIGKLGILNIDSYTNQACCAMSRPVNIQPKFVYYWLMCNKENIVNLSMGGGQPNISQGIISTLKITIPKEITKQNEIVEYLDKKCAEIDVLIKAKEKANALLKEQRQSIIYEAVTKGLNPDVPMKDSGIDWIGKIPERWNIKRIKHIGTFRNGLTYSPDNIVSKGEGTLVLRSSNIKEGKLCFDDNVFVECKIPESLKVKKGDILICSRNGSKDLIGKNAVIDVDGNLSFGAFMMIFRCNNPSYMYYILNSNVFAYYLSTFLTSTVNQLTGENFGNMNVVYCEDEHEQSRIVEYLNKKCSELDMLIEANNTTIEKLKEYRKSVIFEAVTGKVEV